MRNQFQIPANLPFPATANGVIVGFIVFVLVTLVTRKLTRSRQAWIPGLIFGLLAGYVVSSASA